MMLCEDHTSPRCLHEEWFRMYCFAKPEDAERSNNVSAA